MRDKVLIVEDSPLIAEAIERAGEELQLRAERASDGWDAIEKLERERYAAIVIDADLPRRSGFGVLTYLQQEKGTHLENVILMTSDDREMVRRKFSAVSVIGKDDAVREIARVVKKPRYNG